MCTAGHAAGKTGWGRGWNDTSEGGPPLPSSHCPGGRGVHSPGPIVPSFPAPQPAGNVGLCKWGNPAGGRGPQVFKKGGQELTTPPLRPRQGRLSSRDCFLGSTGPKYKPSTSLGSHERPQTPSKGTVSRKRSHPLYRKCLTWALFLESPKSFLPWANRPPPHTTPAAKSAQKPEGQPLEEGKPTSPLLCSFSGAWGVEAWPSLPSLCFWSQDYFSSLCVTWELSP